MGKKSKRKMGTKRRRRRMRKKKKKKKKKEKKKKKGRRKGDIYQEVQQKILLFLYKNKSYLVSPFVEYQFKEMENEVLCSKTIPSPQGI